MIPPGFIQDLLSRVDIVDVVGRHVELKRGGANLMGLCPFHAEKSPSFSVSPSKQFYYCFGCGASGDAIRFLTEHLGTSFVDAVRELAQQVGMQVPEEQVSADEQVRREKLRERRGSLGAVLAKANDFYRAQLKSSPQAIAYLKQRGLTGTIAARFGLGWAPPGWRTLAGVFPRYDDPLLEEAGLVRQREAGDDGAGGGPDDRGRYDWFRERVVFPIRAVGGEVIGFGGRVLDDAKPKYMNSPETPLFSKGRELYGLYEGRAAMRQRGHALVVEGYMDVVALAQAGFANAVATLGTACTAEHVQKLFRFTDAVVFSFDGDAAGRRAAARALEAALPHATDLRSVRFLFLPPEHDPDSYVRELGAAAFEQAGRGRRAAVAPAAGPGRRGRRTRQRRGPGDVRRPRPSAVGEPAGRHVPRPAARRHRRPGAARYGRARCPLGTAPGGAAPARPGTAAAPRRPGRTAQIRQDDRAVRLLLLRNDWWNELGNADHELLCGLPGWHGELFRWLERETVEHGPQEWPALRAAVAAQPWGGDASALVDGAESIVAPEPEDLKITVRNLREAEQRRENERILATVGRHF